MDLQHLSTSFKLGCLCYKLLSLVKHLKNVALSSKNRLVYNLMSMCSLVLEIKADMCLYVGGGSSFIA